MARFIRLIAAAAASALFSTSLLTAGGLDRSIRCTVTFVDCGATRPQSKDFEDCPDLFLESGVKTLRVLSDGRAMFGDSHIAVTKLSCGPSRCNLTGRRAGRKVEQYTITRSLDADIDRLNGTAKVWSIAVLTGDGRRLEVANVFEGDCVRDDATRKF